MTKPEEEKNLQELLTKMDAAIYRLNLLHNRFEKDKDTLLKEGSDTKEAIKSLQSEIADFADMRGEIGKVLSNRIEQGANIMARVVNDSIKETLRTNMEEATYRLNEAVNRAERKIQYFYDIDKKRLFYMALGLIVLPVVTGVIVAKLFMSDPVMKFDETTCAAYRQTCSNKNFWSYKNYKKSD
jgi:hypothetical protein